MKVFAPTLMIATLLIPGPARAQIDGAAMDMTGMGIYSMESAITEAAGGGAKSGRHVRKIRPAALAFTPSAARRRQNLARFLARLRAKDPKGAAALSKEFARNDPIAGLGRQLAPYGVRTDRLADAYALWMAVSWSAARGHELTPSRAQLAAVRAQAAQAFGAVPAARGMSDTTKQQLAEACLLQAMILDTAMTKARGKTETLRMLGIAARQSALSSGVNLDRLTLTPKGFVARR